MSNKVRAKFVIPTNYEASVYSFLKDPKAGWTPENIQKEETRTYRLLPVYQNNDPQSENSKFWKATPSGEIKLQISNPSAWPFFEGGGEVYVDFIKPE